MMTQYNGHPSALSVVSAPSQPWPEALLEPKLGLWRALSIAGELFCLEQAAPWLKSKLSWYLLISSHAYLAMPIVLISTPDHRVVLLMLGYLLLLSCAFTVYQSLFNLGPAIYMEAAQLRRAAGANTTTRRDASGDRATSLARVYMAQSIDRWVWTCNLWVRGALLVGDLWADLGLDDRWAQPRAAPVCWRRSLDRQRRLDLGGGAHRHRRVGAVVRQARRRGQQPGPQTPHLKRPKGRGRPQGRLAHD